MTPDWTVKNGRTNSSDAYMACVEEVARILRNVRVGANVTGEARTIVSRLAYKHGLAPREGGSDARSS